MERVLLALALGVPVPALAASGLAVPLPAIVERLAAALVPFGDAPALASDAFLAAARKGSIVAAPGEQPYTMDEAARQPPAATARKAASRPDAPEPRESYAAAAEPSVGTSTSVPVEGPQGDLQPPGVPKPAPTEPTEQETGPTAPGDDPEPGSNVPEPAPPAPTPTPAPAPTPAPTPTPSPRPKGAPDTTPTDDDSDPQDPILGPVETDVPLEPTDMLPPVELPTDISPPVEVPVGDVPTDGSEGDRVNGPPDHAKDGVPGPPEHARDEASGPPGHAGH